MRGGGHSYPSVQLAAWNITEEKFRKSFSFPVDSFVQPENTQQPSFASISTSLRMQGSGIE